MLAAAVIVSLVLAVGCNKQQTTRVEDPKPVQQTQAKKAAKVKLAKPTNPNNILLNVQKGMTPEQVRNLIGNPQRQNVYPTGKQFIPFYVGPDFFRMDWFYGDFGHVTFSINRFTNYKQVFEVHYK